MFSCWCFFFLNVATDLPYSVWCFPITSICLSICSFRRIKIKCTCPLGVCMLSQVTRFISLLRLTIIPFSVCHGFFKYPLIGCWESWCSKHFFCCTSLICSGYTNSWVVEYVVILIFFFIFLWNMLWWCSCMCNFMLTYVWVCMWRPEDCLWSLSNLLRQVLLLNLKVLNSLQGLLSLPQGH